MDVQPILARYTFSNDTVSRASFGATVTLPSGAYVLFTVYSPRAGATAEVSQDNGSTWQQINCGVEHRAAPRSLVRSQEKHILVKSRAATLASLEDPNGSVSLLSGLMNSDRAVVDNEGFSSLGVWGTKEARLRVRRGVRRVQGGAATRSVVLGIGDSNMSGGSTGSGGATVWANSLMRWIKEELSSRGVTASYQSCYGSLGISTAAGYATANPNVALTGTGQVLSTNTVGGAMFSTSGANNGYIFTTTEDVNTVRIGQIGGGGWGGMVVSATDLSDQAVNITYSGSTAASHTINAAGGGGSLDWREITFATPGKYKIRIVASGASALRFIVDMYNTAVPHVALINCGWNGANANTFGSQSNAQGAPVVIHSSGGARQTDLGCVIVALGINDWSAGTPTPVASYKASLLALLANLPSTCGLIVLNTAPTSHANEASRAAYVQAMKEVAQAKGGVLVDMQRVYGPWSNVADLGWNFDTLHPMSAWYRDQARVLVDVMLGLA